MNVCILEHNEQLKADLAAARAEVERLHGALAASNNDEGVCCHGVGFDEDCDDCEHADTEDGRALPEECREGRGVDAEPSPAALSPKTAAQTSGRHAGTAPGYRVGTDGRAVSHEAAQAADLPEPYSAEVGLQRHIEQAHAISSLLSEAGVGPCSLPEGVRLLMNDRDRLADALAAERIENAHLREAFVTMERAANEREAEAARLREALERIKVSARGLWEGEAARAALDTPAREGGEG